MSSETFGNGKNYTSTHSVLFNPSKSSGFDDEIEEDHFLVRKHLYRYSMNSKLDSKPPFPTRRTSQLTLKDFKSPTTRDPHETNDILNNSQYTTKNTSPYDNGGLTKKYQQSMDVSLNGELLDNGDTLKRATSTPHNGNNETNGHFHDTLTSKCSYQFALESSSPTLSHIKTSPLSSGQTNSNLESQFHFDYNNQVSETKPRESIELIKQKIKMSANSPLKDCGQNEIQNKIQEKIQWFRKQQATSNSPADFKTTLQLNPRTKLDFSKNDSNKLSSVIKKPIYIPPPKKTCETEGNGDSIVTESANQQTNHTKLNSMPAISSSSNLENSFNNENPNSVGNKINHDYTTNEFDVNADNNSNNYDDQFCFPKDQTTILESNRTNNYKNSPIYSSCNDNSPNNRQTALENNLNINQLKYNDKTNLSCLKEKLTDIIALDGDTICLDDLKLNDNEPIIKTEELLNSTGQPSHTDYNSENRFEIKTSITSQLNSDLTDRKNQSNCDNNNNQYLKSNEYISSKFTETLNNSSTNDGSNDFDTEDSLDTDTTNKTPTNHTNLEILQETNTTTFRDTANNMNQHLSIETKSNNNQQIDTRTNPYNNKQQQTVRTDSYNNNEQLDNISDPYNNIQQLNLRNDNYNNSQQQDNRPNNYNLPPNGSLKKYHTNQSFSRNAVCKGVDSVYGSTMSGISSVSKSSSGEEKSVRMEAAEDTGGGMNTSFRRSQSMRAPRRVSSAQKAIQLTIENVKQMPNLNQKERKSLLVMLERKYQDTEAEEARESARREWEKEKKIIEEYKSKKPSLPFEETSPPYRNLNGEYRLGPNLLETTFDHSMMDFDETSIANQSTLDSTINLFDKKRSEQKLRLLQSLERKKIVEKRLEETKRNNELRQKTLLEKQKRDMERALLTKKEKEILDKERLARKNELAKLKSEKVKKEEKIKRDKLLEEMRMKEASEKDSTNIYRKKVKDNSKFKSSSDLNVVRQRQQEQEEQMRHWQEELIKYKQQQELKAQLKNKQMNAQKKEKAAKMRAAKQQQQKENLNRVMEKEEEWKEMVTSSIQDKESRANKIQQERQKQAQRSKQLADMSRGLREELRLNQSLTDLSKLNDFIKMQSKHFE